MNVYPLSMEKFDLGAWEAVEECFFIIWSSIYLTYVPQFDLFTSLRESHTVASMDYFIYMQLFFSIGVTISKIKIHQNLLQVF